MPEDQDKIRLAEYTSLHSEIAQRSSFQQALLALNLTAAGTVVGFVIANNAQKSLLLIVPVISSTLGLIWLDHHRNIQLIARYVRERLWLWEPSWEAWRLAQRNRRAEVVYWLSMGAVYAAGSIGSLAIGHPHPKHEGAGDWVLWSVGVVVTFMFVVAFFAEWRRPATPE